MATPSPKVILRRCEDYDVSRIRATMAEIMTDLDAPIKGRVFVKPNIVTANKVYIHHSYTNLNFTESAVKELQASGAEEIAIGESGGFGIPSRLFFYESGYDKLAKRLDVPLIDLNEDRLVEVKLEKGVHHKHMLLADHIRVANTKVWLPKLKYHIFCSITQCLKLNIGILTHKERMLYHDHRIHEKIVDMLEVGYPDLVLSDAIDITYGFESAPYPVRLGLVLGANDPLAADVIAAHIMGYQPRDVKHLRIASERGYGSLDLADIDISGDYDLDELVEKPKGKSRLFQVLSELDTPIRFFAGVAPKSDTICDGGCEGALKGCLGTIEKKHEGSLAKARKGAIVTGIYGGDVIMADGPVLLIGSCTRVDGKLVAKSVHRVGGCPTAAKDLFIKVPILFHMPSPMLSIRDALLFIRFTLQSWVSSFFRLFS